MDVPASNILEGCSLCCYTFRAHYQILAHQVQ